MADIVSKSGRTPGRRRYNDRTPLFSFGDAQLQKRLKKADEDAEVRELELEHEAELGEQKIQYKAALGVVAMQSGKKVINARRALAEDDPYVDSKLRDYEDAVHLGCRFVIFNTCD